MPKPTSTGAQRVGAKTVSRSASTATPRGTKDKETSAAKPAPSRGSGLRMPVAKAPAAKPPAAKAPAAKVPATAPASGKSVRPAAAATVAKGTAPQPRVAVPKAPVRAAPAVEPKPNPATECPRADDVTTVALATRFLMARPDFERQRAVKYGEQSFKLDRMLKLMSLLGNPHEAIKTVHVAGTNGKGSTVAMISSMLRSAGYAVGTYTSPHLIDIRERVQIDGNPIGKSDYVDTVRAVAKAAEKLGEQPTFFELMTAVGFCHFAKQAVDIAVVEVGLGGRLDSTNVITPLVSVVTGIDLDHTKLLGATKAQIAREKAGIFKKGVPALFFEQEPEVDSVMREVAQAVGADLRIVNKDIEFSSRFCVTPDLGPHTRVCMYTKSSRLEHVPVPLPGEHQAVNCGLALAAVDVLKGFGFELPEDRLTAGLAATRVPGRMDVVSHRPRILCDGAHNPAAMNALMRCVGAHVPYDSMVCIFGCCADKDIGEMIDKVNLGADKVIFTRSANTPRAASPEDLQKLFQERSGKMSQIARSVPEAIEMAIRGVSREDLICVTGSFYVVGEALKHLSERK